MIVKNESQIITRLFDSVISIIDCYCICDTGSTDNTIEVIESYFREKKIGGKVIQEPFQNFGYNRNFSLKACLGMSDYVILLDADMVLEIKSYDKNMLSQADGFHILQGNDSFYYQNLRIVKNNGKFEYSGVTHEYLNVPENNPILNIDKTTLFIRDIGDGGCKNDKFERDVRLLTDGIQAEPNNGRYHFYLANSYHDLGRYEEAINVYLKRIQIGGWREEVWYSYYRLGLCYMKLNKMPEALWNWMEGYNFYPERLEGLYELVKYYRIGGQNKLAFSIFQMSQKYLSKNIHRNNYLFLHNDVYQYKLYYEYTIIAAYNGIQNINDEIITIFNESPNDYEKNNLLSNMKFYKDILCPNRRVNLSNSIIKEINGENIILTSSSSCLIPNNDKDKCKAGYKMNIRYVNYLIADNGSYLNCNKHIITANKYVELDDNLKITNEDWFDVDFDGRRYIGIEDVRIFYAQPENKYIYIGTGLHQNSHIGMVMGEYNINTKALLYAELTQHFHSTTCEKNWVFVHYNQETCVIYDWYPLKLCKLNDDKTISIMETKLMPNIFSKIRGSTCGFHYINAEEDGGKTEIWFVNHMVSYEQPRHYYHIISVFDDKMNLLKYSAPFKFEGEPIEYCLSIVVEDSQVLINYSTRDRTTYIAIYDKKYIDSIIKYYP